MVASAHTEGAINNKRTNSMAFAREHCHTCVSKGVACDRRRPKCSACLQRGWECGGYPTPLLWNHNRLTQRSTNATPHHVAQPTATSKQNCAEVPTSRTFRFVQNGTGPKKRRRLEANADNPSLPIVQSTLTSVSDVEPQTGTHAVSGRPVSDIVLSGTAFTASQDNAIVSGNNASRRTSAPLAKPDDLPVAFESPDSSDREALTMWSTGSDVLSRDVEETWASLMQDLPDFFETAAYEALGQSRTSSQPCSKFTIPQPLSPTGFELSSEHARLLEKYDRELCVLPLTRDTVSNPFRILRQPVMGSPLLLHAILAFVYQHVEESTRPGTDRSSEHRAEAVKLLDVACKGPADDMGLHLLDAVLIIFTLDCTLSARGRWLRHLRHVHEILNICGGLAVLNNRMRAKMAMFLWWDATLALISRQGLSSSPEVIDHLLEPDLQDGWTFWELTGCPDGMIRQLIELAQLAKQNEHAATNTWLTFDLTPVRKIEDALECWHSEAFAEPCHGQSPGSVDLTEEEFNTQMDRFHCAEAWRLTILLYSRRIFHWDRVAPGPLCLKWLARKILDHVLACRRTSQTQKQLLLPVFLAGSEVEDAFLRQCARRYCDWWTRRSRYRMFDTVRCLLEEIWDDNPDGPSPWWGNVIEANLGRSDDIDGEIQYLFG